MAFRVKRKESVPKAVRRLGRQRMEKALDCLEDCRRPEAIHGARKKIKKARAVLRLVRASLPKKCYQRQIKLLKKASQCTSPMRDAYVTIEALTKLAAHFRGQLTPNVLRRIRPQLQDALKKEQTRFSKKKLAGTVSNSLRQVAKGFDDLSLDRKGWKALSAGVKATYGAAQQAYGVARGHPTPECFHAWRKCAKELWYHTRLLECMWPQQMDAIAAELEQLGDLLGTDHDLFMLREAIDQFSTGSPQRKDLETLKALIDRRQRELRDAALAIGRRFFSEKPAAFCRRLGHYWHAWRRQRPPPGMMRLAA